MRGQACTVADDLFDLQQAVQAKLLQNAQKYPPVRKADLDRPVAEAGPAHHVLLDYEDVQPTDEQLRALVPAATHVWVFHGPHQKRIDQHFGSYGTALTAVPISKTGKNALDFHLSFYMGYITSRTPQANIIVVSNDTGYQPVLAHALAMGFRVSQLGHARKKAATATKAAPAKKAAPGKVTARKARAAKAGPVKPAVTTATAPAKKAPAKKVMVHKETAKKTAAPAAKKAVKSAAPPQGAGAALGDMPAAARTAVARPLPMAKILDGLRKMGAKRPVEVASLKRALGPFLGTTVSEEAVAAVFNSLAASGDVVIGAHGGASYPKLS